MPSVKLYNKTGDDKAKAVQEKIEKRLGFLPQAFQAMGRNGDFLQGMVNLADVAGEGLDPKVKELICVVVSAINTCSYCVDAHRALALQKGATDDEITAALEVASVMTAYNAYLKAIGLDHDIKA